jgi:hypothetical protein
LKKNAIFYVASGQQRIQIHFSCQLYDNDCWLFISSDDPFCL